MTRFKLLLGILILVLCSCYGQQNTEEQSSRDYFQTFSGYEGFSPEYVKKLHKNFDYDERTYVVGGGGDYSRYIFLNTNEFFFNTTIKRGLSVKELPLNLRPDVSNFITKTYLGKLPLKEYIKKAPVDGMIILHKGKVVFEAYPRMYWNDKHIWFSVSKTLIGTAIAILEDRGLLDVNKAINTYLSELDGTDWQGISVRNLLDMASGMDTEDKFLPEANFWKFEMEFGGFTTHLEPKSQNPLEFTETIKSLQAPGQKFQYSRINTEILAWLVERVTGMRLSKFIEQEIWQKGGMEFNAHFITTMNGDSFAGAGMNSTLRELARNGLLFVPSGRMKDNLVISDRYLNEVRNNYNKALETSSWYSDEQKYNSYHWDEVYPNGDFIKDGINGQGLYISYKNDMVIAFFGTRTEEQMRNMLPLISRQLSKSGLFD